MSLEKRKHLRFLPQENVYAALGRTYRKVGKVKDISLGGLAFEYIAGEDADENSSVVDIFLVGVVFHLYRVPCRRVYVFDVHVPHVNNKYIKLLTTKRCGLQFGSLNEGHMAQLKLFLNTHTMV